MVVARDCGLAETGNCYLMSIEFPFCKKSSGDGWWRWLHNDMNVLSAELCAYVGGRQEIFCYVCFTIEMLMPLSDSSLFIVPGNSKDLSLKMCAAAGLSCFFFFTMESLKEFLHFQINHGTFSFKAESQFAKISCDDK